MSWPRWKLQHLAVAIAALAGSFAALGVEVTAVGFALISPAILAPSGRRLAALYWVAACYPLIILLSLYITRFWATAALGHPPRPSLDDPKDIRAIEFPYVVSSILLFGTTIALFGAIGLTIARVILGLLPMKEGRSHSKADGLRVASLLAFPPIAWVAGYYLLIWDPFGVLYWYMD